MISSSTYYIDKLAAERLLKCYEIATPRVKQYLDAELNYVLNKIKKDNVVLELGCGYGRILPQIADKANLVYGIDNSESSIQLGKKLLADYPNCILLTMDAVHLAFPDKTFDVVVCIQNGISAFHVDQRCLIKESIRVTKPDGIVLFSTYSEKFWEYRLEWFRLQSGAGLLGEIDEENTKDGNIVCKDGFTATTVDPDQFKSLVSDFRNIELNIEEVDESSVFYEISYNRATTKSLKI